ncbi:hypothetical protein [uncultured Kriegella sp.]|uniref:hypothetical protein n=1 Tax=uncultured Kriegella sp. TaxID=1798910 RepID=UPI0030D942A9
MKTLVRNFIGFALTAIYCFALGMVISSYGSTESPTDSHQHGETNIAAVSTALFYHTPESESGVTTADNHTPSNVKNPFDSVWALVNTTNVLFESKYAQYLKSSKNFLIHYRKADLIFPFHYFW